MLLTGLASICLGLYLIHSQLENEEACQWVFGYGSNMNKHHVVFKKELNISGGKTTTLSDQEVRLLLYQLFNFPLDITNCL